MMFDSLYKRALQTISWMIDLNYCHNISPWYNAEMFQAALCILDKILCLLKGLNEPFKMPMEECICLYLNVWKITVVWKLIYCHRAPRILSFGLFVLICKQHQLSTVSSSSFFFFFFFFYWITFNFLWITLKAVKVFWMRSPAAISVIRLM